LPQSITNVAPYLLTRIFFSTIPLSGYSRIKELTAKYAKDAQRTQSTNILLRTLRLVFLFHYSIF